MRLQQLRQHWLPTLEPCNNNTLSSWEERFHCCPAKAWTLDFLPAGLALKPPDSAHYSVWSLVTWTVNWPSKDGLCRKRSSWFDHHGAAATQMHEEEIATKCILRSFPTNQRNMTNIVLHKKWLFRYGLSFRKDSWTSFWEWDFRLASLTSIRFFFTFDFLDQFYNFTKLNSWYLLWNRMPLHIKWAWNYELQT